MTCPITLSYGKRNWCGQSATPQGRFRLARTRFGEKSRKARFLARTNWLLALQRGWSKTCVTGCETASLEAVIKK